METEVVYSRKDLGGGSLPVQNVQELASNLKEKDIPHRYIRPEMKLDEFSISESSRIPVIDMSKLATDHLGYENEMAKLHQACKEWGFFQLVNHWATSVIEKIKLVIEDFFKLPLQQKMAYAQLPNNIEGYGQAFVLTEDQKLDWGDMLFLLPLPVSRRKMRFWPTTPTTFRSTMDEYSLELHKVCISLVKLMAANLGVNPEIFNNMYQDGTQGIRMNYYPPCLQADEVIGLTPHSDAGGLTLLVQVNEVEGLQIKKNSKWVPVKPIPGAIVINIDDTMELTNTNHANVLLFRVFNCPESEYFGLAILQLILHWPICMQIMSNGEYSSIEQRAVVNFQKERLSIAAFHSPNLRTKIGPLPDLVKENGANYKTLEHEDYTRLILSSKLDGKSLLNRMKIDQ